MFKNGTTIVLRNYLLEGEPIQVALYKDGRIEQRDTASHLRQISNLTINVTVNGMSFELDQHSVLSTPNDLIYAINGADQVQILRTLSKKLEGIDTIAMVCPPVGFEDSSYQQPQGALLSLNYKRLSDSQR
jgi:hypothetical protein